jgi:HSP20 family protein
MMNGESTMAGLLKHETKAVEPFDWFDRMFDEWPMLFPFRRMATSGFPTNGIRVDEYGEDGHLIIRAELPGIDPAKDVDVTVSDGKLHITAERREEEKTEKKGYVRQELRYGSFTRTLPLPEGVSPTDVTAGYKDGILEIRLPIPDTKTEPAHKIPVTAS